MSDIDAPRPEGEPRAGRGRRIRYALAALALAVTALGVPAAWPMRTGHVAAQWKPAIEDRGRRRVACDTLVTRGGCEPVTAMGRQDVAIEFPSRHPDRGLPALKGTLSLPVGPPAPHPAVLFFAGSGGTPRDPALEGGLIVRHEPFRAYEALTALLVARGLAVLRYDKRTCRACYPDFVPDLARFRFAHFEDDARDAHAWLREREDVDGDAVVVMGHSQGGAIAARLGAELGGVRAVVMLAGSLHPFRDALGDQLRRAAALRSEQLDVVNAWLLRRSADAFDGCLERAARSPDEPMACLHHVTHRAFEEEALRAASTLPAIRSLAVPFFAVQGQLDRNVDPASTRVLAAALVDRDAEVHVLAGVGHSLVHERDREAPKLSPELVDRLSAFLASVPRSPRGGANLSR